MKKNDLLPDQSIKKLPGADCSEEFFHLLGPVLREFRPNRTSFQKVLDLLIGTALFFQIWPVK